MSWHGPRTTSRRLKQSWRSKIKKTAFQNSRRELLNSWNSSWANSVNSRFSQEGPALTLKTWHLFVSLITVTVMQIQPSFSLPMVYLKRSCEHCRLLIHKLRWEGTWEASNFPDSLIFEHDGLSKSPCFPTSCVLQFGGLLMKFQHMLVNLF